MEKRNRGPETVRPPRSYGIDQNDTEKWYLLATNLAIDHVPGLVPPLKKGRKLAKRSALRDYQLFWAVSKAKLLNKSVKNTVRQLTNTDPQFKGKNPGTLRDRYYLLKDGRSIEARRLHEFMDWLESEDRMERQMQQDAEERREEHRREEEHALRRPEEDDWEYTK